MPSLTKASLQEITATEHPETVGAAFPVQFNPQSLKLDLASRFEGGDNKARADRQYLGKSSTTLSFDLHFDTADEGSTGAPVSVRTQTAMVERFVLPKGYGNDPLAPPRCRFSWNELVIDGMIESVSIDFELFDASGTPLRAKMGVSIREQDARYERLASRRNAESATRPGQAAHGPGSIGGGAADRSALALGGESAAAFAARMGLDPGAWRGIAARLGGANSLSLSAGASIDFSASLAAGAGIGVAAGAAAGAHAGLEASFGLEGGSGGFALAAAGGVGPALAAVANARSGAAAASARKAFGGAVPGASGALPPAAAAPRPALPAQPRTPVRLNATPASRPAPAPAPAPPAADPRAVSYGFGVPLRPRAAVAPPAGTAAGVPAWLQEPGGAARRAADRAQARRLPPGPCCCH